MGSKIIFVTGGARSGKSSFALKDASGTGGERAYIATAEALDVEMRERIQKHREDRGGGWDTFEEPLRIADTLAEVKRKYSVIIIDCLTVWLSNVMFLTEKPEPGIVTPEEIIQNLVDELRRSKDSSPQRQQASRIYLVSNEVGMGIVPDNALAREFRDRAGSLHQKVAELSDEVYLIVAGMAVKIKDQ
jgi:adenosylcobinamide kinase/adenosylcobinamide-phosphate guanylyltransferase